MTEDREKLKDSDSESQQPPPPCRRCSDPEARVQKILVFFLPQHRLMMGICYLGKITVHIIAIRYIQC